MARAFVFPGQGSQAVGMGQELAGAFAAAREVYEEVDDALSQNLSKLMAEGPEGDLTLTENAQPALMAVSMAVVRVLEKEGGITLADHAAMVAGHSLGEYSALCAAGALEIGQTAKLLKLRGQSMQKAVPVGEGAMAALMGASPEVADKVATAAAAATGKVCSLANDNADGQVVISGATEAVEQAIELAKDEGVKRGILLPVSAPFHCAMMQPAADAMAEALASTEIAPPALPVVANVTAEKVTDPARIRELLIEQIPGRVRWRESVLYMKEQGVEQLVELGSGKVLTGMVRRIDKAMTGLAINTADDIEKLIGDLS